MPPAFGAEGFYKAVYDGLGLLAEGGTRGGVFKIRALYLPGIGIVLGEPQIVAFYDLIVVVVLQKHPNDRGFGQIGVDTVPHFGIRGGGKGVVAKAGAVVVIHGADAIAVFGAAMHGGVHRKIAALGVARQIDAAQGMGGGHGAQIFHGAQLCGHGAFIAHPKILLPADQRVVGALKGHQQILPGQQHRNGGELHTAPAVDLLLCAQQTQGSITGRGLQHLQQLVVIFGYGGACRRVTEIGGGGVCQTNGVTAEGGGHCSLQPYVGEHRKDQRIYGAKSGAAEGKIAAPFQVIEDIAHGSTSFDIFYGSMIAYSKGACQATPPWKFMKIPVRVNARELSSISLFVTAQGL